MIAILGSGFGLYGYLPALTEECGQQVILPERYRSRFEARPELARFAQNVHWAPDEMAALDRAEGVVLALRPVDQAKWIPRCLERAHLKYLLLEKPLANSPETAARLWADLAQSDKNIRMGYTFRFTEWAARLREALSESEGGSLSIRWNFLAHHFRFGLASWKQSRAAGGGAIRFYGIQLIALLAEFGYRDVLVSRSFAQSEDNVEKWMATLVGPRLPECSVVVDTRAAVSNFQVERRNQADAEPGVLLANFNDPFAASAPADPASELDPRVPVLTKLCRTLWEPTGNERVWYEATIELWRRVEAET